MKSVMLATKADVIGYFSDISELLTEYEERSLNADRLELFVRSETQGVILAARLESGSYQPYIATSVSDEATETGTGFRIVPDFAVQPTNDARRVAASIRAALGETDAT